MTGGQAPYCWACNNLRIGTNPEPGPGFAVWTCDAFPAGIPEPIIAGTADHRLPFEGDNGLRFEQDPAVEPIPWRLYGLPEKPEPSDAAAAVG